jgi:hypothetical protein
MTDRFAVTARDVAAAHGLPGYPFVEIDHPIAGDSSVALRAKAERAVTAVVSLLTRRGGRRPA